MNAAPSFDPLFWQAIPGWFDFDDLYRWAVDDAPREPSLFVELGTWMGRSLAFLAGEIVRSGKPIALTSVDLTDIIAIDPHVADPVQLQSFRECNGRKLADVLRGHLRPCLERGLDWTHYTRDSGAASEYFADGSVRFCFVDANHSYECVRRDLEMWWRKIEIGGRIAGHDHTPAFPGVAQAVAEFFGDRCPVKLSRSSWYVDKL